jgi:short-subunit dehydrogenase
VKRAIIIGATSGIGRALAKLLSDNDFKVGITGRRTMLLTEIKNENPDLYYIKSFDISDTNKIPEYLSELTNEIGGLDLIVLCSGTGDLNIDLDFETEKRTIDTNVYGFTAIADWSFNFFKKQKHGHFAAITSVGGLRGNRHAPSYSASKAYQINYLEGLRQKAAKQSDPIIITDIRPGFVNTDMAKGDGIFWMSQTGKAASQILKGIWNQRKIIYVTRKWRLIAILLKLLPNRIFDKI